MLYLYGGNYEPQLASIATKNLPALSRFLLKNNYKIQSILLVRKRFKHIWFLTIRVLYTRFCPVNLHLEIKCETLDFHTHLEIECLTLDFLRVKSSPLDSIY